MIQPRVWSFFNLAILSAIVLMLNSCSGDPPLRLRILTYNIHHGEGMDREVDLARIAAVIRSAAPDIAALQEVDQGVERTQGFDQPSELARLTGMEAAFGANLHLEGGRYGNAVLSRWPIQQSHNRILPLVPGVGAEQRGVLAARIRIPRPTAVITEAGAEPELLFLATHFDYRADPSERLQCVEAIESLLAERLSELCILAGDLNDTPGSSTLQKLSENWAATPPEKRLYTIPGQTPDRQIDHVLFRPARRWKIVSARAIEESQASDHRPLLVILELQPPE
jgi:endonuclease/exonuclease/phosphatase family metal-dependent hydrolase